MSMKGRTLEKFVTILLTMLLASVQVQAAEEEQIVIEDLTVPQLRAEIEKLELMIAERDRIIEEMKNV